MIRINLLPKTVRRAPDRDWRVQVGGVVGVLILLGMGYAWWSVSSETRTLQGRITTMQAELRRLDAVAKKVERFKADKRQLEQRLKVIQTLLTSQSTPVQLLSAISVKLPKELWLTSLSKTGSRLVIRGFSFTDFGIASFMTRLSQTAPLLKDVELVISEQAQVQKVPVKKFEIVCRVNG